MFCEMYPALATSAKTLVARRSIEPDSSGRYPTDLLRLASSNDVTEKRMGPLGVPADARTRELWRQRDASMAL